MGSEAQTIVAAENPRRWDWWKFGDGVVLLAYSAVALWTLQYHEKWADEAQAWLIARDLNLGTIWFHELRYEGSPGLWHTILWVAQHVFHAGYGSIGYIGAVFAIAGAAVLVFCAPFPRYVRWPLAFTYVMVYQYAVIARPYTLLPLLLFLAAMVFEDKQHPERLTAVLVPLGLLTLHGAILSGAIGLAYLVEAATQWTTIEGTVRQKYWICAGVLVGMFILLAIILWPTPDLEEFAWKKQIALMPEIVRAQQPTWTVKLESIVSGAFLDYMIPSVLFILVVGAWCASRKKLLIFTLPTVLLIGLYVGIHGYAHHHGTITLAAITAMWIAWPKQSERRTFSKRQDLCLRGMVCCLLVFCAVNIWDAGIVIKHEYLYPYSGAGDAARFLADNHAERQGVFGLLYGVVGIQAYFDHNIFENLPSAFFHHGMPLQGDTFDPAEVARVRPGYIVVFTEQPQLTIDSGSLNELGALGYRVDHFSDGYLLYKAGVYVRQTYFIFRRVDLNSGESAVNENQAPTRVH